MRVAILRASRRAVVFGTVACVLGLLASGCGDESTTGPEGLSVADLAGSWVASRFAYSQAGGGVALPEVDLVAEGAGILMEVERDGGFELVWLNEFGQLFDVRSGSLAFEEEAFLVITFDDEPGDLIAFVFTSLSEDSFRLTDDEGQVEFDLDGDGTDDPARLEIVLDRLTTSGGASGPLGSRQTSATHH